MSDKALHQAVKEMSAGLFEAHLGSNLFKKRVARPGQGKSGGFRTIVATSMEGRWFFLLGFAKSERDNLDHDEVAVAKQWAKSLSALSPSSWQ